MSEQIELIEALPVVRDELGFWTHPGIPDFDEDGKAYKAWLIAQGLKTSFVTLEDEDDSHPVRQAYWPDDPMQECSASVVGWNPEPPTGDGWFVLSIHDTEDGPYFVWARRIAMETAAK